MWLGRRVSEKRQDEGEKEKGKHGKRESLGGLLGALTGKRKDKKQV